MQPFIKICQVYYKTGNFSSSMLFSLRGISRHNHRNGRNPRATRRCGDMHAEHTRILQKLFDFQHTVTDADVGLDVLGVRILFDFLAEGCHVYS